MTKKQKTMLLRILVTGALYALLLVLTHTGVLDPLPVPVIALYLVPYLLIGYDILLKAARNIAHGQIFDENFLMLIATVAAFCIGEYPEAVAV
ncbi:MAG: heavy metal translocating P-type ATPase, partial [Oscillospiraceae bacterium]|nr:heavy metal translocating P-type ATPase [Oscillospiraceae bacterium]